MCKLSRNLHSIVHAPGGAAAQCVNYSFKTTAASAKWHRGVIRVRVGLLKNTEKRWVVSVLDPEDFIFQLMS